MALVSIIVPSFNHAPYLEERLQSILAQTVADIEILVLDDASTDGSRELLQKIAEQQPNIILDCNRQNSGSAFKQWNRGLRAASGKYIWIAESDDVADPEFLATLVGILEANPSVGLAYCRSILIDEAGNRQAEPQWMETLPGDRWQNDFIARGSDEIRHHLVFGNTIPNASAVVFRRELVGKAGYVDEQYRFAGDWWFWSRLLRFADVAYCSRALNYYRRHSTSFSLQQRSNEAQFIEYQQVPFTIARSIRAAPFVFRHLEQQLAVAFLTRARQMRRPFLHDCVFGLKCLRRVPVAPLRFFLALCRAGFKRLPAAHKLRASPP